MSGAKMLRIALVTGAVVLAAGIYLLPKKPQPKEQEQRVALRSGKSSAFSFEKFVSDSKVKLGWDGDNKVSGWEKALNEPQAPLALYDSIGNSWDAAQIPGIAAWYYEQKAGKSNDEKDWLSSGYRYFDAFKSSQDSLQAAFFVEKAITAYEKVIALNPKNLNAKSDLGVLYAEGTASPMKGIMMLREVVNEDPRHENANLNLGFLSMKSGQYDKAVERFKKVLEINPSRIDMYVYMGEGYLRMNNKEKAIESFEVFKNLSNDQEMIKEMDSYITSIRNSK
jgi:tetratricopeptide (TPR) repeat protein